ncbi:MAG: leucine-rich repeat protein [Bacteroidetes bacterium]|nr:leucine-rich repeat protein [Bacteroidota bacterium]
MDSYAQTVDISKRSPEIRYAIGLKVQIIDHKSVPVDSLAKVKIINLSRTHNFSTAPLVLKEGDFDDLTGLEVLNLQGRKIKNLPDGLFDDLTSLKELNLESNSLSSLQKGLFGELSKIKKLHLGDNALTVVPEGLFKGLSMLELLDLSDNTLESLPENLFDGLSNLLDLYLNGNKFTDLPLDLFDGLSKLKILNLEKNSLTSLQIDLFDGLSVLSQLILTNNKLTSVDEDLFDDLKALNVLELNDNELSSIPENLFDEIKSLNYLNLGDNELSSVPEDLLDTLTELLGLNLENNDLTELPKGLFDFKNSDPILRVYLHGNPKIKCLPQVILDNRYLKIEPRFASCGIIIVLKPSEISEKDGESTVSATTQFPDSVLETTLEISVSPESQEAKDADYILSENITLTIGVGKTTSTGSVTITAVDNHVYEGDKKFTVSGNVVMGSKSNPKDAILIIKDDEEEPIVTLELSKNPISENDETTTITATLDQASTQVTTVTISADPISPASTSDFTLSTNTILTIPVGQTSSNGLVTITALDNETYGPERKEITVSGTTNSSNVDDPDDVTLTILDDDAPPRGILTLTLSPTSIDEDRGSTTITATLNPVSSDVTTVTISAFPESPATGDDYRLSTNTTLTIPAGQTSSTGLVTITAIDNETYGPERKEITVSGTTNSSNVDDPDDVTLTILDDDAPPRGILTLTLSPTSIDEDRGSTTITATLNPVSSDVTTVTISAFPVSPATSGDFTLSSNVTLTIPVGQTSSQGTVTITALDNEIDGPERKEITVSGTTNSSNVDDPDDVTLTILDDDAPPRGILALTLSPTSINEDGGLTSVTATLNPVSSNVTTVIISAFPESSATGDDYRLSTNTTLTILAGQTSSNGLVTITALDNETYGPERKEITVSGTTNSSNVDDPDDVTLTILDDDAPPRGILTLTLSPTSIDEDRGSTTITATLNPVSSDVTTVTISAFPESPATGNDYRLRARP